MFSSDIVGCYSGLNSISKIAIQPGPSNVFIAGDLKLLRNDFYILTNEHLFLLMRFKEVAGKKPPTSPFVTF